MAIFHFVGNSNCNIHLRIENTGGRPVTVEQVSINFEKDNRSVFTLIAEGYFAHLEANTESVFTPIALAGGDVWAHLVHCFENFTREDQRRVAAFQNAIRTDITGQIHAEREKGFSPEERGEFLAADEKHVAPAMAFFNEHFRYEVGEYVLTVQAACSPKKASTSVRYRMTLYESDVDAMRAQVERFKYGVGIYWFQPEQYIAVMLQPAT